MKRFVLIFFLLLFLPIPVSAQGVDSDMYNEYLESFDLSSFDKLDDDTNRVLHQWGIDNFDFNKINNVSVTDFLSLAKDMLMDRLTDPLSSAVTIIGFVILSSFVQGIKDDSTSMNELYSVISALVISLVIMIKMTDTITLCTGTVGIVGDFIYAFVPAFAVIVSVSGGITTSFSTNATLLMLAQGMSFLSGTVFVPICNCFLALGICSSLRYELHLDRMVKILQRVITGGISFLCAIFVSVLSIKTAVSARADMLGIRSIRFAINTVVPVIGSSISEGLLAIQNYSSLIKSSVGIVGIIGVALVFMPAIIQIVIWRLMLSICGIVSDIFDDKSVGMVLSAFRNTMLIINVILILSMVTTVISIGILIAARVN